MCVRLDFSLSEYRDVWMFGLTYVFHSLWFISKYSGHIQTPAAENPKTQKALPLNFIKNLWNKGTSRMAY